MHLHTDTNLEASHEHEQAHPKVRILSGSKSVFGLVNKTVFYSLWQQTLPVRSFIKKVQKSKDTHAEAIRVML